MCFYNLQLHDCCLLAIHAVGAQLPQIYGRKLSGALSLVDIYTFLLCNMLYESHTLLHTHETNRSFDGICLSAILNELGDEMHLYL